MPSSAHDRPQPRGLPQNSSTSLKERTSQLESLVVSLKSTLNANKGLEQPGESATDTRFSENMSELVGQDGAEASEWETID